MKVFQHKFEDEKESVKNEIKDIYLNRLPVILILDRVTNIGNVGMIFRLADALRIEKVYLYKIPEEFKLKTLKKKSRATIKYVPFEYIEDINGILKLKQDYEIVVLDKTNESIPYNVYNISKPVCIIIGAEKTGVSEELINISDLSLHLPMNGINTSINVATATSAILYDMYNKLNKK